MQYIPLTDHKNDVCNSFHFEMAKLPPLIPFGVFFVAAWLINLIIRVNIKLFDLLNAVV